MVLKVNGKRTMLCRLRVNKGKEAVLGNEKIDHVGNFAYLGRIISENGGYSKDIKKYNSQTQDVSFQMKYFWKNRKLGLQTKNRILEAKVMKVIWF